MKYILSQKYDAGFIKENMMGPNSIKLAEEILAIQPIPKNSIVLDFGCGRGATSIFMVKEFGLRVFAADLWITPTENKQRFDEMQLTDQQIVPISVEAHAIPFAEEFFDAIVCIDAYQFFGCDKTYLGQHLLPFVKHGGYLLITVPGFIKDIHDNIPEELLQSWTAEDIATIHDMNYWTEIFEATDGVEIVKMCEMEGYEECWNDWLASDNEYAIGDRKSMEAGAGKYMNFIAVVLKRK